MYNYVLFLSCITARLWFQLQSTTVFAYHLLLCCDGSPQRLDRLRGFPDDPLSVVINPPLTDLPVAFGVHFHPVLDGVAASWAVVHLSPSLSRASSAPWFPPRHPLLILCSGFGSKFPRGFRSAWLIVQGGGPGSRARRRGWGNPSADSLPKFPAVGIREAVHSAGGGARFPAGKTKRPRVSPGPSLAVVAHAA